MFLLLNCTQRENKNVKDTNISTDSNFVTSEKIENYPSLPLDTLNALRYDYYKYPDNFAKKLPSNSYDYFSSLKYPYYLPSKLSITYFCKRLPFKVEDFFIFKKLNNRTACEYIALTDTTNYFQIIGQQCIDMENWISLYVFNKDYKIIDFDCLIISSCDSIIYYDKTYYAFRCETQMTTDSLGNEIEKIKSHKVKIIKVLQNGKISSRDSLITRN